jgi:hypothetical protein
LSLRARGVVQLVVAVGVGLQDPGEAGKMPDRMLMAALEAIDVLFDIERGINGQSTTTVAGSQGAERDPASGTGSMVASRALACQTPPPSPGGSTICCAAGIGLDGDPANPRRVFISGQKRGAFGAITRELPGAPPSKP